MKFIKNVGITLLFVIAFALGVRLRDSRVQFVPQAYASDDSLQSERSCDLRTLFGAYGIATTGSISSLVQSDWLPTSGRFLSMALEMFRRSRL